MTDEIPFDKPIRDIASYVHNYTIPSSPTSFKHARGVILDSLGCAIETLHRSSEACTLLGPVIPGTTFPYGFHLPGTSYVLDPVKGTFDLGVLIRYLDHNDAFGGAEWGHPSDTLSAIIAVMDWLCRAEQRSSTTSIRYPPLTIKTLLEAAIKAYEIQGCYQLQNAFNAYGIDHVILVKLAAASVCSWLMGMTETQTISGANTTSRKGWAAADAAMRAVHLCLLTHAGQLGSKQPLNDKRYGFLVHTFGLEAGFALPRAFGDWAIQNIFTKLMPCEGHGISAVEAALVQGRKLKSCGHTVSDIKHIDLRVTAAANLIISKIGRLYNAADRDHCIQYVIALAFLKGRFPDAEDYMDDSPYANSKEMDDLREKIMMKVDQDLTQGYLDPERKSCGTGMTVYLNNGTVLDEVLVEYPAGHLKNPRTKELHQRKFEKNMRLAFTDAEIANIVKCIEDDEMPISSFVDLFTRDSKGMAKL
ncbi:prpd, putative [Talaromyces stipitatus ATCC 10500]|uniref:Alkylcitrate dehydratase phiI n=1 Tax=Talaromyces stipitatus (strain ATCC 10500 / CBS 375.48 / QM 6759 / NRRL 1006) TaxID=441959 RepID=TSTI_TALSN|nr:prpd, putative [Talaromyces stipitatus ATCC 10500]B8MKZ4.1 RecName: Full=Alkylcitrate dehydratase phiI; Short=ACDH; AltName: Full=Phomoidride biosynthesis cluster protein I [Talaromyces stipitatus ATCC 10500]EED15410.1 prpd, putative [Talaromyces stipitatus ATCC 10500]